MFRVPDKRQDGDEESVSSSSSGSRYEEQDEEDTGLPVNAMRLFPQSPVTPVIPEKLSFQKEPSLFAKNLSTSVNLSSARKLDLLQKALYTPLSGINHEPM